MLYCRVVIAQRVWIGGDQSIFWEYGDYYDFFFIDNIVILGLDYDHFTNKLGHVYSLLNSDLQGSN